jgi:hypothetical protein
MEYIETIKHPLFGLPLGEEVGDYVVLNLASGLAGDMMKVMFGLGMSNTGKGIMTKALQLSCGQYVDTFNAEFSRLHHLVLQRSPEVEMGLPPPA